MGRSQGWYLEAERSTARQERAGSRKAGRNEDAVEWAREKLGFTADAKQAIVLRSQKKRGILNCSRQWGKSTVIAVKAAHYATHEAGSLTLVVGGAERQSREFVRKVSGLLAKLGIRAKGGGGGDVSLALPNGSRIVGLPASEATVRGFSAVGLLLMDEAAAAPDDLYLAVRPMLAVSGGSMWLMSTPRGKRGFFYEVWEQGGPEWERVEGPATECPRISAEFLEEERRAMGERWFRQEYLCGFEDVVSTVFRREDVERAFTDEVEPLDL